MPVDFTPLFNESKGRPILFEGRTIAPSVKFPVRQGEVLAIEFVSTTESPVQGLRVALSPRTGRLSTNKTSSADFVFWADTAPRRLELEVAKASTRAELTVWNVWRTPKDGTMMYGTNAAAIDAHDCPGGFLLRCSDGWGEPDFDNLVVRIVKLEH
jgi:hypothetical protein